MKQVDVRTAIINALKEQRTPQWELILKVLLISVSFFVVLSFGLGKLLFEEISRAWIISSAVWTLLWGAGYWFYAQPQPRMQVRGFWSPFVLSRLLVATIVVTILHLFVCPHFAFVETKYEDAFPFFQRITDFYMSLGGHDVCMFLCGLTFGGLAAFISSLGILRTLSLRQPRGLTLAALAVPLSFAPLLVMQWSYGHIHWMTVYWLGGSLIAALIVVSVLGFSFDLVRKRRA